MQRTPETQTAILWVDTFMETHYNHGSPEIHLSLLRVSWGFIIIIKKTLSRARFLQSPFSLEKANRQQLTGAVIVCGRKADQWHNNHFTDHTGFTLFIHFSQLLWKVEFFKSLVIMKYSLFCIWAFVIFSIFQSLINCLPDTFLRLLCRFQSSSGSVRVPFPNCYTSFFCLVLWLDYFYYKIFLPITTDDRTERYNLFFIVL